MAMFNTLVGDVSTSELINFGLDRSPAGLLADEHDSEPDVLGDGKGEEANRSLFETGRDVSFRLLASNSHGDASITFNVTEPVGWKSELLLWEWAETQLVQHCLATVILTCPLS